MARIIDIAEQVLLSLGRPASVMEIIDIAKADSRYRNDIRGLTPAKTLQARISTDIVSQRERSHFYRYAPSVFGLRHEKEKGRYDQAYEKVHLGNRRRKLYSHSYIACISKDEAGIFRHQGLLSESIMPKSILKRLKVYFIDKNIALQSPDYIKIKVYYFVTSGDLIVRHEKSDYDERRAGRSGSESIGFGTWVTERDISLFSDIGIDIEGSAIRDFADLFSFLEGPADERISSVKFVGYLVDRVDDYNRNILSLVCQVALRSSFDFEGKLGVKNLHWISSAARPNYFSELETMSKYLVDFIALSHSARR